MSRLLTTVLILFFALTPMTGFAKPKLLKEVEFGAIKNGPNPIVAGNKEWPFLDRVTLKHMPEKFRTKYYQQLRKAVIDLQKAEMKKFKKNYSVGLESNSFFATLVSMTNPEATASSSPNVGDKCLYSGWPSEYRQLDGWSRPYCVPPNASGSPIEKNDDALLSAHGGKSCSDGQIMCPPFLYCYGKSGNPYCTSRGRSSFKNCQSQYAAEKGYGTKEISKCLEDNNLLGEFTKYQDTVKDICEKSDRQPRLCDIIKKRFASMQRNGMSDILAARAKFLATQEAVSTKHKFEPADHCGPTVVTEKSQLKDGKMVEASDAASCLSCALQTERAHVEGIDDYADTVSRPWMTLASTATYACTNAPIPSEHQLSEVYSTLAKLGSCSEDTFGYDDEPIKIGAIPIGTATNLRDYADGKKSVDKNPDELLAGYGIHGSNFKDVFCTGDGRNVASPEKIKEKLEGYADNSYTPLNPSLRQSGQLAKIRERRKALIDCLDEAQEYNQKKQKKGNGCSLVYQGDRTTSMVLQGAAYQRHTFGSPTMMSYGKGNGCSTLMPTPDYSGGPHATFDAVKSGGKTIGIKLSLDGVITSPGSDKSFFYRSKFGDGSKSSSQLFSNRTGISTSFFSAKDNSSTGRKWAGHKNAKTYTLDCRRMTGDVHLKDRDGLDEGTE